MFTLFFHFFLSFAYSSAVATGSPVSSLIRSIHLFLGLRLFLFLLQSSFIIHFCKLSPFRQHTCPNQVRRLFQIMFSIHFCCFALFRILSMETRSCSLMFNIALRQLLSNTLNFFGSSCVRDHFSELYIAVRSINALQRRSFNLTDISLRDHTLSFNLPNAESANAIFLFTLCDGFGTSDPKNLNSFTISIILFLIVKLVVLSEITLHFQYLSSSHTFYRLPVADQLTIGAFQRLQQLVWYHLHTLRGSLNRHQV